jgi:hypothetical protein
MNEVNKGISVMSKSNSNKSISIMSKEDLKGEKGVG